MFARTDNGDRYLRGPADIVIVGRVNTDLNLTAVPEIPD